MTMKKKILTTLSVVLILGLAALGILAYLQSEDSDVNVMTLGEVSIQQNEMQRIEQSDANTNANNLEKFRDEKPLYPAVYDGKYADWAKDDEGNQVYQAFPTGGSSAMWTADAKNTVDKIVFVENNGKSSAYVRTWFAFEQGSMTEEEFEAAVGQNINNTHWNWETIKYGVEIDGNIYAIKVATYIGGGATGHENGVLKAGETTRPSLLQVMLYNSVTNEDVEKIDGNKDGKFNILVTSQAIQTNGFSDAKSALNAGFGTEHPFKGVETWNADADLTPFANYDTDTEFEIKSAEQLAGLTVMVDGGKDFTNKTVKLAKDLYIGGNCFEPIGSYKNDKAFKGTFDGQGNTINNLDQNTWALNNGYYYGDLGLGLFGLVEDAVIRDLNIDNASISGESAICGTVAATAYGDCTFENITVMDAEIADYQYYAGGIVGWASGNHQYINCEVDSSTTIAAQWGDFDNSTGGVIGGAGGSAKIFLKDCDVACRIDAYNDVTSSYQWYAYRRCGMLIGNPGKTQTVGGTTYAAAPQLTCENVTVTYNDWANYTYCEFAGTSWPYVRVQAGVSNSAYSNPRYGHPKDANGNEVVDDNHVHNAGEDHQILCVFDQLYGGGQGVYGWPTHDGVTVVYNNK